MENLLIVYGNATEESRYEEMNLWYSWVHIRDVLTARAALACQRFELSKWQPRNADLSRSVLCAYEIVDRDYCNRWHVKDPSTWRMRISMSFTDYWETFWDLICETANWQEYADYRGERALMTIKMRANGEVNPEDYFTLDMLKEIQKLPGVEAAHFYDWKEDQQMPVNTPPAEPNTHNLVLQISNCYMVANEWNKFLDAHPEIEKNFHMQPAIWEPQMHRIRDVDLFSKPEWRAIQALAHLTLDEGEDRANPAVTNEILESMYPDWVKEYIDIERRNFRDI